MRTGRAVRFRPSGTQRSEPLFNEPSDSSEYTLCGLVVKPVLEQLRAENPELSRDPLPGAGQDQNTATTKEFLHNYWEAGIAQCLEIQTRDRKVAGSSLIRNDGRILFSRVNFLC